MLNTYVSNISAGKYTRTVLKTNNIGMQTSVVIQSWNV